jgi:hypothetical protein
VEAVEGMRCVKTRLGGAGINRDRTGWAATDLFFIETGQTDVVDRRDCLTGKYHCRCFAWPVLARGRERFGLQFLKALILVIPAHYWDRRGFKANEED